jgi:uncharacterized membrane protein
VTNVHERVGNTGAFCRDVPDERAILTKRATTIIVSAISAVALAARIFHLQSQSLWMDEIATVADAHAFGNGGLTAIANADHIAPLYSIIVWIGTMINGDSEFMARLPSAIAGTLTVPMFYLLGTRLFRSQNVGLISAVLAALSPFAVWYGQEARGYTLLLLCVCSYVFLAWPIVCRRLGPSELVGLFLITAVGLYCHHYMILVCAAFGLFLVFAIGLKKSRFWIWLATQVIAFIPFVYWLALTANELRDKAGVAKQYLVGWVPYTIYTFAVGFSYGPSVRDIHTESVLHLLTVYSVPVFLAASALLVAGLMGTRKALRAETRQAGIWCIIWTAVPIGLAILGTFVTNISYNVRYSIGSFPPFILCLAFAVEEAGRAFATALVPHTRFNARRGAKSSISMSQTERSFSLTQWVNALSVFVLVGCMLTSLYKLYFDEDYAKENVRRAAQYLRENYAPSIHLIVDNVRIIPIMAYYGVVLPPNAIKAYESVDGRFRTSTAKQIEALARDPAQVIWLLEYRPWESDPHGELKRLLDSQAFLVHDYSWSGVSVYCYRTRPLT